MIGSPIGFSEELMISPVRMFARRRQAVDNLVDLAEIGLDHFDGLRLHFIGEGIAVDALGIQAGFVGVLVERSRVVPARRARLGLAARPFEEDAEGGGATAKGSGDAARP